jgi:hypothetical protein
MPELTDHELDERLAQLEQELGPTLRRIYANSSMRPAFAASGPRTVSMRRPFLRVLNQHAFATLAAVLVGAVAFSVALFAIRPQPANASEVLGQLQAEARQGFVSGAAVGCGAPVPEQVQTAGVVAMQSGGFGPEVSGPVTLSNANELSDKLAAELGVTGDRVRAAMLATVQADLPTTPPPDPMQTIANQLGLTRDQVCAVFLQGSDAITGFHFGSEPPDGAKLAPLPGASDASFVDLNTVTAEQLKDKAQKLGVSPERLLSAVKAVAPPPGPPLKPLNPDAIIRCFAQNLGMSEDKVRAALNKVEGSHGFYFAVPVPGLSR